MSVLHEIVNELAVHKAYLPFRSPYTPKYIRVKIKKLNAALGTDLIAPDRIGIYRICGTKREQEDLFVRLNQLRIRNLGTKSFVIKGNPTWYRQRKMRIMELITEIFYFSAVVVLMLLISLFISK